MPAKITRIFNVRTGGAPQGLEHRQRCCRQAADRSTRRRAATSQTGDHVTLTNSARSLQKLSDAIAQSARGQRRQSGVDQAGGAERHYQVDAASVADKLLQFDSTLKYAHERGCAPPSRGFTGSRDRGCARACRHARRRTHRLDRHLARSGRAAGGGKDAAPRRPSKNSRTSDARWLRPQNRACPAPAWPAAPASPPRSPSAGAR